MNRPAQVKPDNFFLLLFNALRQRRVPLALRIASHSLLLVALALVIYAWVMGMQFKQAMQQQADALGQSLTVQTAASATELLVSNDILSLNVLLSNLAKNPLVAHAAIYSVDNRILAEAGSRPTQSILGETEGLYSTPITFQEVIAGQLRISLDMQQFQQPMTISLQSMGLLSLILLALTMSLSLRLGRHISTPLLQLRVWLRDPDDPAPGAGRQDEIGDLARQLQARLVPEKPEPSRITMPNWMTKTTSSTSRLNASRTSTCRTCAPTSTTTKNSPRPHRALRASPSMTKTIPSPTCATCRPRCRNRSSRRPRQQPRPMSRNSASAAPYWPSSWAPRNSCATCRAHACWSCCRAIATAWSRPRRCTRASCSPSTTAAA